MLSVFLLLSFLMFSNAFYVKQILPKTKLYGHKHSVKKAIQIFNIIDIIQPSSISKFIQYKLFFKNAYSIFLHNFKEEFYELNLSSNIWLISLSGLLLCYLYIYNAEKINKLSTFKKEEETEDCLYKFDIIITFISYFLFKDVLSAC